MILSIIIPVYNVEKYVGECLRSILSQDISHELLEIVIVNDGTPDDSMLVVSEVVAGYDNVKIINQTNQGLAAARNAGLREAAGKYVWFVDSDDWISDLREMLHLLETSTYDMVSIVASNDDGTLDKRNLLNGNISCGKDVLMRKDWEVCATFYIYRREFLKEKGLLFLPGIFHEDVEFTTRALYLADTFWCSNIRMYIVRNNVNSITHTINPKRAFDYLEVAERLMSFSIDNVVEKCCRVRFCQLPALLVNNALSIIVKTDNGSQNKLDQALSSKRRLIGSLWHSHEIKYMLEYILFRLSIGRYVKMYRTLKEIL